MMKAIHIDKFGGPENLVIKSIPIPTPAPGELLIKIKAFGLNHAETHMRRGEWAESVPISGIECVGIVISCPGNEFPPNTKVAALMGGMGRTRPGSYAEYTVAAVENVVALTTDVEWEVLGALPESYATAWTCLFRNLEVKRGQTVLIRGGTSGFGVAAVNLAVSAGVNVIATTRSKSRFDKLLALGVKKVELEGEGLSARLAETGSVDAVLDLVGNSTVLDSLKIVKRGGRVCIAGFLGGLAPIREFNPLAEMASGVHLSFFGSFVFGTEGFPVSDVPLQEIVDDVKAGKFNAKPARVFKFDEIVEAHRVMDANEANGKLVVVV
jgi:NADPH:quinone reductase-like Zn-dependent oxidoreductase